MPEYSQHGNILYFIDTIYKKIKLEILENKYRNRRYTSYYYEYIYNNIKNIII